MRPLTVFLFGTFRVLLHGQPVSHFGTKKTQALFVYLLLENQHPHNRGTLAELLWPEQPEGSARNSLRQSLHLLRQILKPVAAVADCLKLTRDTVHLELNEHCWVDSLTLTESYQACLTHTHNDIRQCAGCIGRLEEAVTLYNGEFLPEFIVGDSNPFEGWQTSQRHNYQQQVMYALYTLASHFEVYDLDLAHRYAQKLTALDNVDEKGQETSLRILARQGQRGATMTQFEAYRQELSRSFGVAPSAALQSLMNQIRLNQWAPSPTPPHPDPLFVPTSVKTFVGRKPELQALTDLLHNPACRLLTITGTGGIGKSALVRALARQQENQFRHGICLVMLAGVRTQDGFYQAIGEQLGLSGPMQKERVLAYLRPQQLLLVCDGLDAFHDLAHELVFLLRQTTGCKIIATSRVCLNITGEWIYPVGRLESQDNQSSAVQLFVQYAQQSNPRFVPTPQDLNTIRAICDLLRGNPLSLEMAAAWLRVLSCDALWQELRQDLHFLISLRQDAPTHHRSVQALFEDTWQTLSAAERAILEQLSVFRRRFSWAEAAQVAHISLPMLADLLDRSLLVREVDQVHYAVPEMVRRFAAAYLVQNVALYQTTMQRFSRWYGEFLAQQTVRLYSYEQLDALQQIRDEWSNIEPAWEWARQNQDQAFMAQAVDGLSRFFDMTEQWALGREWFAAALAHGAWEPVVRGRLSVALAWMMLRLQEVAAAYPLMAVGVHLLQTQGETPQTIMGLAYLARAYQAIGDLSEALAPLQQSVALSRQYGDNFGASLALTVAGVIALNQGEPIKAGRLLERALILKHIIGDIWGAAEIQHHLGEVALAQQAWSLAQERLTQALNVWKTFANERRSRQVMMQLGYVTQQQQEFALARGWYEDSLHLAEKNGDEPGIILAWQRLGQMERELGQWDEAIRFYQRALALSMSRKLHQESQTILAAIGMLLEEMRPQRHTLFATVDPGEPLSASLIQELNRLFQAGEAWRPQVEPLVQIYLGDVEKLTADLW